MYKKLNIPLSVPVFLGNELKYVKDCISTTWICEGKYINSLEGKISKYVGSKFAVACSNGTGGLHIALKLLGVESGNEVICPTVTFVSPINTVKYIGAEPVFMDCDEHLNLDPYKFEDFCKTKCKLTKKGLINKTTKRIIKAIIVVHVFGNPAQMDLIMKIARKYKLKVIEDATESLGSYYTFGKYKGKFTGSIGDIGVFSFNGNKIITSAGGGLIVTNNKTLANKAKYLINQAKDDAIKYIHNNIGYNYRISNLQAAIGVAQFEQIKKIIKIKKSNYCKYKKLTSKIKGLEILDPPKNTEPNYWFYALKVSPKEFGVNRDGLMRKLNNLGIQTRPLWYLNHRQIPFRKHESYKIVNALKYHSDVLNIPCSINLTEKNIKDIVKTLQEI